MIIEQKIQIYQQLGKGSYGTVLLIKRKGVDEYEAMKQVNCPTLEKVNNQLQELFCLSKASLSNSRYVNKCRDFKITKSEDGQYRCYYILDYAPSDMKKILALRKIKGKPYT